MSTGAMTRSVNTFERTATKPLPQSAPNLPIVLSHPPALLVKSCPEKMRVGAHFVVTMPVVLTVTAYVQSANSPTQHAVPVCVPSMRPGGCASMMSTPSICVMVDCGGMTPKRRTNPAPMRSLSCDC
jgi:hypothetical protein